MNEVTSEQTGSGSKKVIWIVIGVVALLVIVGLFMGGFSRGTGLGSAYFAPGVDVDRNVDGTMTYSNDEASVTVGTGASLPSNWPPDAPEPYAGATISYSGTSNPQTGASGSAVVYTTTATAESVAEYYTSRLTAEGWTIEGTANMGGAQVISAKKDTRTFGVYIADTGGGVVQVTAGVEL